MKLKCKAFNNKTLLFPFTEKQLNHFGNELIIAGSFHKLMFEKHALERIRGMKFIRSYRNKYLYRNRYLSGIYQNLKPFYDTEIPFVFWSAMYESFQRMEKMKKCLV